MPTYRAGTVTLTNNSKNVTGSGTQWANAINGVFPGMIFIGPDGKINVLATVASNTALTLEDAYTGSSGAGQTYKIITTYEGDISQFSARFTALLARFEGNSDVLHTWLTSTSATMTWTKADGTTETIATLKAVTDVTPLSRGGSGKSTGAFANAPNVQSGVSLSNFLDSVSNYGNNSAGSANITDDGGTWHTYLSVKHRSGVGDGASYGFMIEDRGMLSGDYASVVIRKRVPSGWLPPATLWHSGNLESPSKVGIGTTSPQVVSQYSTSFPGGMMFYQEAAESGEVPQAGGQAWKVLTMPLNSSSWSQLWANHADSTGSQRLYYRNRRSGTSYGYCNVLMSNQYTVDANGFYKTASPVINIYSDGSFTTTDEAEGVNVERLSEGVYKITGCCGMHSDAAWGGSDGGVSNPKCRNGLELTWNDFEVDEAGSVIVRTYHRPHPDAISFARNEIDGYENGDQIDVPKGLYIQVRVNMPERIEPKQSVMHSNVYSNTIPAA